MTRLNSVSSPVSVIRGETQPALGWKAGQNVQFETRWATADPERIPRYATRWATADRERVRRYVADLVALELDVIVAPGNAYRGSPTGNPLGAHRVHAGFRSSRGRLGKNADPP